MKQQAYLKRIHISFTRCGCRCIMADGQSRSLYQYCVSSTRRGLVRQLATPKKGVLRHALTTFDSTDHFLPPAAH